MKLAIVDDERPARSELRYLVEQCRPEWEIQEAGSCEEMVELLETEKFQGAFVDIQLGDRNGTTLASMLLNRQPGLALVFATAYQEYALKAFEVGALDYLLKPYSMDQVERALKRMEEKAGKNPEKELLEKKEFGQRGMAAEAEGRQRMTIAEADGVGLVDISDIIYISTEERGCKIHLKDQSFFQNQSLNYYEERLEPYHFFRIYKSYLVNLDYVEKFVPSYNNGYGLCLKYVEQQVFPIGRSQCRELRKMFEF